MTGEPVEWASKPIAQARAADWPFRHAQFAVRREMLDAWYRLSAMSALLRVIHREEELLRAMRVEGEGPTVHAIAHSIARILHEDHLRMLEQLDRARVPLRD